MTNKPRARSSWAAIAGGVAAMVPSDGRVTIGSDASCDLVLEDPHVSSRHCALSCRRGGLFVEDLESTNGTWIGEARVTQARVDAQVTIRCGQTTIVLARQVGERAPRTLEWCGMIGRDQQTLRVWCSLAAAARSDAPLWLLGESGVGKERAARALHEASARSHGPWVALNCAALPDEIAEAELFGVVRGAFTGADRSRTGAFGRADGGTLLLDEIGELSPRIQAKLLRVIETGEVRPIGGDRTTRVDVRVIAATWQDLELAAELGRFRHDLLHRLWVLRVELPALRSRPDDIASLLEALLDQAGASSLWPDPPLLREIEAASWPGNVRQLKNHVLRASVSGDLHDLLPRGLLPRFGARLLRRRDTRPGTTLRLVRAALREHDGNRTAAARALGVSRSTFYRWLRRGGSTGHTRPPVASPRPTSG